VVGLPAIGIRVLIADDEAMVRGGFRMILDSEDGIEVVAEAADGALAVSQAERFTPDVVVMDIQMPVVSGIEATRTILERVSPPRACSSSPRSTWTTTSTRRCAPEQAASC
jgi:DNA-binding NarL/FixJ family response regulator